MSTFARVWRELRMYVRCVRPQVGLLIVFPQRTASPCLSLGCLLLGASQPAILPSIVLRLVPRNVLQHRHRLGVLRCPAQLLARDCMTRPLPLPRVCLRKSSCGRLWRILLSIMQRLVSERRMHGMFWIPLAKFYFLLETTVTCCISQCMAMVGAFMSLVACN